MITRVPLRPWAVAALGGAVAAVGLSVVPPAEAARASCVSKAERRAADSGMSKAAIRRPFDGAGEQVKRTRHTQVRRYLACGSAKYVIVTYRHGRVTKIRLRAITSGDPTNGLGTPGSGRFTRYDADGNGTLDLAYDSNGDGYYDTVLSDLNGNGRFETVAHDTGYAMGVFQDSNEDGYYESVVVDADRNGRGERILHDGNGDGFPEWQMLDHRPVDGVADTWFGTAPSSTNSFDRAADNLMVSNISALNQMRQFDPTSLGYIPSGSTPTLLSGYNRRLPDYESIYN